MIDYPTWHRMKDMAERDRMTAAQIDRELGLTARTVREWLKPLPGRRISGAFDMDMTV